jgi:hypothetical protein
VTLKQLEKRVNKIIQEKESLEKEKQDFYITAYELAKAFKIIIEEIKKLKKP